MSTLPPLPPVRKRADYSDIQSTDLTFALFWDTIGADLTELDKDMAPISKAFTAAPTWQGWANITKVDEEQRIVYGVASSEAPDDQPGIWKGEQYRGDIVSSAAMKAATPDYMQFANIRAMHQPIAAGTCVHLDTRGGQTDIAAHITDDQEWRKVTSGTYKGFSIGGKALDAEIVKIDGAPYRKITKLKLTEISLVDRPANSDSRITLYKGADMDAEQTAAVAADETELSKAADPTKAVALLQQLRNDAENDGDTDAADAYTDAIRQVLIASGVASDTGDDGDDDDDDQALAADDTTGDNPGASGDVAMAEGAGDVQKVGAAMSAQNMAHAKTAHDALQKMTGGAVCAGMQKDSDVAMADGLAGNDLVKALVPTLEGLTKLLEANGIKTEEIAKRLDALERKPAPGAPVLRVVEKSIPGATPPAATPDPVKTELEILKAQRDSATDPGVLRWLGTRIAELETKQIYKGA